MSHHINIDRYSKTCKRDSKQQFCLYSVFLFPQFKASTHLKRHRQIETINLKCQFKTTNRELMNITKMKIFYVILYFIMYIQNSNSIDFDYPSAFNFGDSNSDTGDLVAGLGIRLDLPNGQNSFKTSSQRFCDGRLVIDFLSKFFSFLFI